MEVPGGAGAGQVTAGGKHDNSGQVAALKRLMRSLPGSFRVIETRFWKHMKVPIVILGYRSSSGEQVETDISVGVEFEGVQKGLTDRIVRRLLARFPRAMHTARLVKLWAKVEKLNKAYDGYLNALGWTLLVLFYFIERGQIANDAMNEEEPNENGPGGDGSLPPQLHPSSDFRSPEEELLEAPSCEEAADFFEWLADYVSSWPEDPPESAWGISLVDGTMIEVPPPDKKYADQCQFFIEDPAPRLVKGTSENVARSLKVGPWQSTVEACREAVEALRAHPSAGDAWLARLLQEAAAQEAAKAAEARLPATRAFAAAPAAQAQKRPWPGQPRPPQGPPPNFGQPPAKRPRTEMCKWFLQGECWSGDRCKMSHG
mmetsp:Transcript_68611/g.221689  ORF Transcript_68611/g.221689 Transcript_68611/m.221689 type:complete len:373 (+) Transcript_68611:1-1119(+)